MSGFRFDFNGMLSCFPALKLWLLQQQMLKISYKIEVLQQSTLTRKCFSQHSGIILVIFLYSMWLFHISHFLLPIPFPPF